jgi:transposase-like protein
MKKNKGVDDAKRLRILEEHLSGASKYSLAKKYGLSERSINSWLRKFGLEGAVKPVPEVFMKKKTKVKKSAEVLALEQENRRLKVSLAHAEMAAKAYSTMVDLAEETYQIEVRKNFDTGQS